MSRPITLTRRYKNHSAYETPIETEVATEEELLEFANKLRQAGGANMLDALLPSIPGHSNECLIANALNFSGRVDCRGGSKSGAGLRWYMELPENMDPERVEMLAKAVGCDCDPEHREIDLPQHIGNAAHAFDSGDAFQEYQKV